LKTILLFIIVTACILTSLFAFADVIAHTGTSFNFASMISLGFCLLGLAKFGKKIS
jgi:hypothetical protein